MGKSFTLCLFLVFLCRIGVGQQTTQFNSIENFDQIETKEEIAAQHLQNLKNGILIVRLRSDQKKIEKLKEFIDKANQPSTKAKYEKMLDEVTNKQLKDERDIINAMKQNYSWSDFVFMYDYQTPNFTDGRVTFFSDEDQKVTLESLGPRDFYILSAGLSDANGTDVIEILDNSLNPIPHPFPGTVSITGFQKLISLFSSSDMYSLRISKLNKKLLKAEYLNSSQ